MIDRALALPRVAQPPLGTAARRLRLMIVDDSMVARAVLSRMIQADDEFEIVAVAGTAEDAVDALGAVRVDIILLDLEMPGAGGLKSIPRIVEAARGARIMIVSSLAEEGAEQTLAALALGAADTLPKPGVGRFNGRFSEILLRKLKALGPAEPSRPAAQPRIALVRPLRAMANGPLQVLAIGASTGGIHALGGFFAHLPRQIGLPILVTQHLPAAFMTVFARQLGTASGRKAFVAEDGMELVADQILIAPGDAHLTVERWGRNGVVRLSRSPAASGCLPSVDPMLASLAPLYGSGAAAVILSGMGRDGAVGAARLVECGGSVLVQDEDSCAVWGMPRAALEAGLACAIMPPDKLAHRIGSRALNTPCT